MVYNLERLKSKRIVAFVPLSSDGATVAPRRHTLLSPIAQKVRRLCEHTGVSFVETTAACHVHRVVVAIRS